MRAQLVSENVNFKRNIDPIRAMGLGLVSVTLDYHNFELDEEKREDGIIVPDTSESNTASAVRDLDRSGLEYEFFESNVSNVEVKLTGPRGRMAPFVAAYLAEPVEMVRNAFYKWDGKEERDIWELMGY